MNKIIIKKNDDVLQIAKSENGILVDYKIINQSKIPLAGNIYVGIVETIINNAFAFVNIGENKNGFIDLNDFKERQLKKQDSNKFNIKQGDHLLLQVVKDGTDIKGCNLTSEVSITGKSLIIVHSDIKSDGISKKIPDIGRRKTLKKMGLSFPCSVIFRTEAKSTDNEEIIAEYNALEVELTKLVEYSKYVKAPAMLKNGGNDLYSIVSGIAKDVSNIYVDCDETGILLSKTDLYPIVTVEDTVDIFSSHYLTKEIETLYKKKVWLKSGGFIIIDYGEAGVLIDVNTGKNINTKEREKLVLKTNMEAAEEIGRQVHLRNLSGMILIDFIDMKSSASKVLLLDTMKNIGISFPIPIKIHGYSNLGLMELTRKKTSEPIYKYQ